MPGISSSQRNKKLDRKMKKCVQRRKAYMDNCVEEKCRNNGHEGAVKKMRPENCPRYPEEERPKIGFDPMAMMHKNSHPFFTLCKHPPSGRILCPLHLCVMNTANTPFCSLRERKNGLVNF
jgi:glutamyl/glutaminyl-tRNA synthetase